ncbi:RNA 2'-phosphotransferase [Psychrobacter sp. I-STPA10]|uniref:RNA 2'-phosphotransferase n=1 Tax=Psychrobacter sp. I-STPA10 TaxID=2585769 RepID=UPI001E523AB1|nr:RNA 2'-phosphotransferase [Psychrobacter sp. I-STPA10]
MNPKSLTNYSKFLSYILRHRPDSIGITLDSEGWANINELINNTHQSRQFNHHLSIDIIKTIVANDNKQRFALSDDEQYIRAVQGHSKRTVQRSYTAKQPPDILYHGTASRFLESILQQGLLPKSRQYVHLSADKDTAKSVGQRYGKVVILQIDAKQMADDGITFYQAENGVWLVEKVEPIFFKAL